jgi:hypothetical protein
MTDRDLHPAAQAEALRRADAATFDRLVAAAFNGDQTADDRRLAEHRDSLARGDRRPVDVRLAGGPGRG